MDVIEIIMPYSGCISEVTISSSPSGACDNNYNTFPLTQRTSDPEKNSEPSDRTNYKKFRNIQLARFVEVDLSHLLKSPSMGLST